MISFHQLNCCGVREIHGLSTYTKDHLEEYVRTRAASAGSTDPRMIWPINWRFAIYTQAWDAPLPQPYGEIFTTFILENRLGTVQASADGLKNPNTNRNLKLWTWTVDQRAVLDWISKLKLELPHVSEIKFIEKGGAGYLDFRGHQMHMPRPQYDHPSRATYATAILQQAGAWKA